MKIYVVKNVSKKSGKEYIALVISDVFGDMFVSFDQQVILRVSGLTIRQISEIEVGSKFEVGSIDYNF